MTIFSLAMSDNDELQQIAHLRREYTRGGLRRRGRAGVLLAEYDRLQDQHLAVYPCSL